MWRHAECPTEVERQRQVQEKMARIAERRQADEDKARKSAPVPSLHRRASVASMNSSRFGSSARSTNSSRASTPVTTPDTRQSDGSLRRAASVTSTRSLGSSDRGSLSRSRPSTISTLSRASTLSRPSTLSRASRLSRASSLLKTTNDPNEGLTRQSSAPRSRSSIPIPTRTSAAAAKATRKPIPPTLMATSAEGSDGQASQLQGAKVAKEADHSPAASPPTGHEVAAAKDAEIQSLRDLIDKTESLTELNNNHEQEPIIDQLERNDGNGSLSLSDSVTRLAAETSPHATDDSPLRTEAEARQLKHLPVPLESSETEHQAVLATARQHLKTKTAAHKAVVAELEAVRRDYKAALTDHEAQLVCALEVIRSRDAELGQVRATGRMTQAGGYLAALAELQAVRVDLGDKDAELGTIRRELAQAKREATDHQAVLELRSRKDEEIRGVRGELAEAKGQMEKYRALCGRLQSEVQAKDGQLRKANGRLEAQASELKSFRDELTRARRGEETQRKAADEWRDRWAGVYAEMDWVLNRGGEVTWHREPNPYILTMGYPVLNRELEEVGISPVPWVKGEL